MSLGPSAVRGGHAYAIHLTIGQRAASVHLEGAIGSDAAADLSRLMESLEMLAYMAVDVDLSAVTSMDRSGFKPLIEASRKRTAAQLPPVLIGKSSPQARSFLDAVGLEGRPHLNLSAWDRAQVHYANRPGETPLVDGLADAVPAPSDPSDGAGTIPSTEQRQR
jgi:hypothetical protein